MDLVLFDPDWLNTALSISRSRWKDIHLSPSSGDISPPGASGALLPELFDCGAFMLEESIWSGHQRSGHQLVLCSVWASIRKSLSCLSRSTILIDFHEPSTVSKSAICCQTASTSRAVWSCSTTTQFLCLSTCKAKSAGQPLVLEADIMKEAPTRRLFKILLVSWEHLEALNQ